MKIKTDRNLIEQATRTLKEQGKPVSINEICKLTGYYYQQIYNAGYQSLAKKHNKKREVKPENSKPNIEGSTVTTEKTDDIKFKLTVANMFHIESKKTDYLFYVKTGYLNIMFTIYDASSLRSAIEDAQERLNEEILRARRNDFLIFFASNENKDEKEIALLFGSVIKRLEEEKLKLDSEKETV